jgi:uroporphyrinogen decarboxylase
VAPTRRIVERLKAVHPNVPVIGFPRGAGLLIPSFAGETGIDAVSLDQAVPMHWAARQVPDGIALQGNLDPACLVVGGAVLDQAIDRILEQSGERALVFNLGHGIVPQTPPEHVGQLAEHLRRIR